MARKSSSEHSPISALERFTVVMLGVYLSAVGIHMLTAGHMLYRNYLRSPVLAPIAVIIGLVLIGAGLTLRK
ncbi:MAG TPA: hypothetical protein VGS96_22640 [Thermoanaerobaculia bacterium]|nr:hypothetical protein [Thermoanaerobaculia bacterium]